MSLTQDPGAALREPAEIHYPESDGKPMAETDRHRDDMVYFIEALKAYFAGQDVYVSGNILLYYEEGDPKQVVSPDGLVVFGLKPGPRRVYKTWVEGKVPDLVIEVTSLSTRGEDRNRKSRLYARLGVQEMWLVDPLGEYLGAPLRGYRLHEGSWVEIPVVEGRARSAVLGLEFCIREDAVRLVDPETGRELPAPIEAMTRLRTTEERLEQTEERLEQTEERLRSQDEELAVLRAELARLRGETDGS